MTTVFRRRAPLLALACFVPLAATASHGLRPPAAPVRLASWPMPPASRAPTSPPPIPTPRRRTTRSPTLPAVRVHAADRSRHDLAERGQARARSPRSCRACSSMRRIASDPTGQARFLLRLPKDWNGRLVVAGASGTRSEFNGDFAWSDYVLQKGYAYASQNKGVLNLQLSTAGRSAGLPPQPGVADLRELLRQRPGPAVHALDGVHGQGRRSSRAMASVRTTAGRRASPTRWARPTAATRCAARWKRRPSVFDGGVDWEGTFVDEHAPNLLTDLPPAILNYPDYVAVGPRRRTARPPRTSAPPAIRPTSSRAPRRRCGRTTGRVLGSDAVPVAEAPRPDLRHLRRGHGQLQLRGPPRRPRTSARRWPRSPPPAASSAR